MKLFIEALIVSLKHSSRRLLCLLCIFAVCATAIGAFFSVNAQTQKLEKIKIAVINNDRNPLSNQLISSVTSIKTLAGMLELDFVNDGEFEREQYAAVIIVPLGFVDSVLNGENISPIVEINNSSPMSAVWVRQMAYAGTSSLTTAQHGIYAAQKYLHYGANMDSKIYDLMVLDMNVTLIRAFLDRTTLLKNEILSVSGELSLMLYYVAAISGILMLCYGFLFQPAIETLRRFSMQCKRSVPLFFAAFFHCFILNFAISVIFGIVNFLLVGGSFHTLAMLVMAFLSGAFAVAVSLIFHKHAACAACCVLLSLGMGLCSGAFLPLAMMPSAFEKLAPFLPVWQISSICEVMLGATADLSIFIAPIVTGIILLTVSFCLWKNYRGAKKS